MPQFLRHTNSKNDEFAIHKVYSSDYCNSLGPTEGAVSNLSKSANELKEALKLLISLDTNSMRCGDSVYGYFRDNVAL